MSDQFHWPIFGHQAQQKFLQQAIIQNKLANTYLFYGPSGLGKKMTAQCFVQSIFCQAEANKPCQHCQSCRLIKQGTFADVYELGKGDQELSIDNIRDLLHSMALAPVYGGQRVALIYGLENLNLFGANALLKTLEEPGRNTTIILISNSLAYLPSTLISRCQMIKFQALRQTEMMEWLEEFKYDDSEKETIANLSFGRPGLALAIMSDQMANFKKSCNFIVKLLSGSTFYFMQTLDLWFEVLKKEHPEYKVYELGTLTKKYLDLLEVFLRDILWQQLDRPLINKLYQKEILTLTTHFSKEKLVSNILSLHNLKEKLKYNVSPQLVWENLFLNLK